MKSHLASINYQRANRTPYIFTQSHTCIQTYILNYIQYHTCMHIYTITTYMHAHRCIHATCPHIHTHTPTHTHLHTHIHTHQGPYTHTHTHTHTHKGIHTHTHTHTHPHTHTHNTILILYTFSSNLTLASSFMACLTIQRLMLTMRLHD